MNLHLAEIAKTVAPGAHAVLLVDQAGWHLSTRLVDDLVDHCCEAWNKLVDQPWWIMSIGLRQWAHGF
jgi:hypothetical protein